MATEALERQLEQARKARQISERRFLNIVERNADGILVADREGVVRFVNRAAERLLGRSADELVGSPFGFPMAAGQMTEIDLVRGDGEPAVAEMHVTESEWEGRPVYLATLRDVTARAQAEAAVRFQAQLLDAVEQAVVATDRAGTIIHWNRFAEKLFGWPTAAVTGRNIGDVVPAPGTEKQVAQLMGALQSGQSWSGELQVRRRDGPTFPAMSTSSPIHKEGNWVGAVHVYSDIAEQKRVEETLRESEAKHRLLVENLNEGIWYIDEDARTTFVNPRMAEMLGYTVDEMLGKRLFEFMDQRGVAIAQHSLERRRQGIKEQHEFEFVRKDGSRIYTLLETAPITNDQGQYMGAIAGVQDITQRKEMEEMLRRRGAELAVLHVIARKVSQSLDLEEVLDTALEQALTLLGAEGGLIYLFEEDSQRFIPMAHRGISQDVVQEVAGFRMGEGLSGRAAQAGEALVVADLAADPRNISPTAAREGWRSYAGIPMRARDRILGVMTLIATREDHFGPDHVDLLNRLGAEVGMAIQNAQLYHRAQQEISERRRAEKERIRLAARVHEQARQMEHILATVPTGVLLLDVQGRILQANPTAERDLAALARAEVGDVLTRLGNRPLAALLAPPPKGLWHEVRAGGRTFEAIARPVEDGPRPEHWVLVINDVTREREIQTQLQQQERLAAVGQLAAGIAHDFNNIMAAITLYAQMAARSETLPQRDRERMAVIDQQARHATRLIQQILDFSRRAVLERRPLDLRPLLKEQVELLKRTLPEHIGIELDCGSDEYTVDADPTRVQQMLTNLAVNARDAMPGGGTLRIGLQRVAVEEGPSSPLPEAVPHLEAGDWIRLTVSDTGTGIPPEALPHIFEPFFTTKESGEGSGLGLAQVHGIVGQHGGHVDVESQIGEGTTFAIYLPTLEVRAAAPPPPDVAAPPRGRGQMVLVVEDEDAVRTALVASLEGLNYHVLEAADGEEALTVMGREGEKVALVLSDVVMPGMGGLALFRTLRERGWRTPVILLTGHPMDKKELDELWAQGLKAWLTKPPSIKRLAQTVADALRE